MEEADGHIRGKALFSHFGIEVSLQGVPCHTFPRKLTHPRVPTPPPPRYVGMSLCGIVDQADLVWG